MFTSADAIHHLNSEPTPEALHREEYFESKGLSEDTHTDETMDHNAINRARLLRAQIITRVGSYFA